MRKYLFIVFLLSPFLICWGQRNDTPEYHKKDDDLLLRFGYYLGINQMNFKSEYTRYTSQLEIQPQLGFNVGLFADLRIINNINLRFEPGMFTTQRDVTFPEFWPEVRNPNNRLREVKSTYIRLPLMFKFSTNRIHNTRPFVV
ncbi:MAG: porin family protein, partial [Bacteroidota bacterium]|nr:porin family protein [Bacteroidota bacterium]